MKPIPIKQNSSVFESRKRLNVFQQLHSQEMMGLMRYFYDHVSNFKKMWKDQGKEYWLRFCITLHTEIKFEESSDSEVVLFMKRKEFFALELIMNCLCGSTFPPLNKLLETVWKIYKDLYKLLQSPNAKLPCFTKEENEWGEVFDYLFGMIDTEFPSMEIFFDLCEMYFFAVGSLTKVCQEYDSVKYSSDKPFTVKDYWQIPLRWLRKNYEPTPFEVILIGSHETEILKFLKEENKQISWIENNMEDMIETCRQNEEELILMPKELQLTNTGLRDLYCWFFLSSPEIFDEFCHHAEVTWGNFTHPHNQFYITFYHSIFNSKFLQTVSNEIKSLLKAAEKKKGNKDEKSVEKMGELCKLASFVDKATTFTIRQLTSDDFHFFFDRDLEVVPTSKDESESDVSCSSLLEEKSVDEWKNWDPLDNAHLETSQATLDRLPWDMPFLMAWQENVFALCLKIDIGTVPLRVFPVSTSCKQVVINFNRLLRESLFLVLSSMIIADFVHYTENEAIYNWTFSIDYRKKLHEIGYRLRPILDFVDSPAQNSVLGLVEKAWPQTKSDTREKWEPGRWESTFEGIEQYFFQSSRHYVHWESAPTSTVQFKRVVFEEAYNKIKKIAFCKENLESNCYYQTESSEDSRYDLDETEKALAKDFGQDLTFDVTQSCESMIKSNYLTKQDVSRLQKKMLAKKVPTSAASYIISLASIYKKCETVRKKMSHWAEDVESMKPTFIELLIEHRQTLCGFKINCAVQELINDDPKFLAKPTSSQLEKALEYAEERSFNKLNLQQIESVVKKNRKRVWADNPIPQINKKLVPPLKKEHSFKASYWESQSVYKNYTLMEKHRTELIRLVIDKYFSTAPGTPGLHLFPYWKTLVCFIHSELFVIVKIYEANWKSKETIHKMFQLVNFRMIWLREKVKSWCKDMKGRELTFSTKSEIKNYLDEQYCRIRFAGNSLRDLYLSRFTVNEKYQPMTKAMMNYSIFIQVLLSKIYDVNNDSSDLSELAILTYGDCFLRNADELVDYLETFKNHASICWNYKELEFYPTFRPISFENCETVIYILKNLLYLCLISIEDRDEIQGDLEICLLKAHSMESELIDQKAVRGPSSPETDDFNLYLACMESWQFFTEVYEKAKKKKDFVIPKAFSQGCQEWKTVLENFKKNDVEAIQQFIKFDSVLKSFHVQNCGPCSTCPGCNGDFLKALRSLDLIKKKEPVEKKPSKNKTNNAKKANTEKLVSGKSEPTDKELFDMLKSMISGKGEDKPGKHGQKPAKRDEFSLDKSSDQFKKIIYERVDKFYNNGDAKEKKENGKTVNIAAEGFKKMFASLNNKDIKKSDVSEVTVKSVTETKKTEVKGNVKTVTEVTKTEITGLAIASEGMKKMFNMNSKTDEDGPKFKDSKFSKSISSTQLKNIKSTGKHVPKKVEDPTQEKEKLKYCSSCKAKQPDGVKFKKCAKCKEENRPNPKFYCGRDCQLKDWVAVHRVEHVKASQ